MLCLCLCACVRVCMCMCMFGYTHKDILRECISSLCILGEWDPGLHICALAGVSVCSAERRIKAAAHINAYADTLRSTITWRCLTLLNIILFSIFADKARNTILMKMFLRGPALRWSPRAIRKVMYPWTCLSSVFFSDVPGNVDLRVFRYF